MAEGRLTGIEALGRVGDISLMIQDMEKLQEVQILRANIRHLDSSYTNPAISE
jgi:hypothetical protein